MHLVFSAVWCQAVYSKAFSEICCPLRQNVVSAFFNGSLMLVAGCFPTMFSTGAVDSVTVLPLKCGKVRSGHLAGAAQAAFERLGYLCLHHAVVAGVAGLNHPSELVEQREGGAVGRRNAEGHR